MTMVLAIMISASGCFLDEFLVEQTVLKFWKGWDTTDAAILEPLLAETVGLNDPPVYSTVSRENIVALYSWDQYWTGCSNKLFVIQSTTIENKNTAYVNTKLTYLYQTEPKQHLIEFYLEKSGNEWLIHGITYD